MIKGIKLKKKTKAIFVYILFIAILSWLISVFFFFTNTTKSIAEHTTSVRLEKTAISNNETLKFSLEKYQNILISIGEHSKHADANSEGFQSFLKELVKIEDFSVLAIIYPNNTSFYASENDFALDYFSFTEEMQRGRTFISDVIFSEITSENIISINVPIFDSNNKLYAYVKGSLPAKNLSDSFNTAFFNDGGHYMLVDEKGKFVASSVDEYINNSESNFFGLMNTINFVNDNEKKSLQNAFITGGQGLMQYEQNEIYSHGYFLSSGINNWVMINVVTDNIIAEQTAGHLDNGTFIVANLLIIFFILLVSIFIWQNELLENAEMYENNFRTLSEQIDKAIFEWDVSKNTIVCRSNFQSVLGRELDLSKPPSVIISEGTIHEDDADAFFYVFSALKDGQSIKDIQFRLKQADGIYVWCSLSALPIFSNKKKKKVIKAIGLLENVDYQVKKNQELKARAEQDPLTGIYNKMATEQLIKGIILSSSPYLDRHTLMIVDIDNFKEINDKLGHFAGDNVIKELSIELKSHFRNGDVVGRIGGDEFFVFIRNFSNEYEVRDRATEICNSFYRVYSNAEHKVQVSASIGIACYGEHGNDFKTLYNNADSALYATKQRGKNGFTIYNKSLDGKSLDNTNS